MGTIDLTKKKNTIAYIYLNETLDDLYELENNDSLFEDEIFEKGKTVCIWGLNKSNASDNTRTYHIHKIDQCKSIEELIEYVKTTIENGRTYEVE